MQSRVYLFTPRSLFTWFSKLTHCSHFDFQSATLVFTRFTIHPYISRPMPIGPEKTWPLCTVLYFILAMSLYGFQKTVTWAKCVSKFKCYEFYFQLSWRCREERFYEASISKFTELHCHSDLQRETVVAIKFVQNWLLSQECLALVLLLLMQGGLKSKP